MSSYEKEREAMWQKVADKVGGKDGEEIITAEALAQMTGPIPYEILCGVGERVPRFYLSGGHIVHIQDNIIEGE